ncbi:MAG: acetyl-CoA carboxylase biotin carboxylase subunit [Acidobacteria bacterium]|nr:MAG: acetyl-CoA carboxylase biotin carboxylase subunit [Acidobacteriota bacterium]
MFKKILVANRGEIALRIIYACKELGIKTVAVFSEADRHALHVRFADEAICIGPPKSADSYLNIPSVISAAEVSNVDAIHPGYGFLSESAYFAEVCEVSRIKFIGPSSEAIRLMGDKVRARREMNRFGLPVLPGSADAIQNDKEALATADAIGYPVIIKAIAGGGGRGMRVVGSRNDLLSALKTAQAEASSAFGAPHCYLEKFIERARHIEFQIIADEFGNAIHAGERECSIQRRHQKLIEEAPSVIMTSELRAEVGSRVVQAIKQVGYSNVGTVEFLVDERKQFYFMEMNTRIQVEHPVTELLTGIDLVRDQILIAAGERLPHRQSDIQFRGHALECRINAEDPLTYQPSPGKIISWHAPGGPGVRIDTAAYAEYVVPPYYDSLIAKVITHGPTRDEAIRRMERALDMFILEGVKSSIPLHRQILRRPDFRRGDLHTKFLEQSEETRARAVEMA